MIPNYENEYITESHSKFSISTKNWFQFLEFGIHLISQSTHTHTHPDNVWRLEYQQNFRIWNCASRWKLVSNGLKMRMAHESLKRFVHTHAKKKKRWKANAPTLCFTLTFNSLSCFSVLHFVCCHKGLQIIYLAIPSMPFCL